MSLTLAQEREMKQDSSLVLARSQITIDASVDRVWQVLAEDFAAIGKWSSGVDYSEGSGKGINGSKHTERACKISAVGFSDTKERILQYDHNRTLRYSLYHGLPGFVTSAENTWTLEEISSNTTHIVGQTEMHVKGIMGFLFRGLMRSNLDRVLAEMAEEVKYFIEKGRPHPKKLKAIAKYEQKLTKSQ